jgi:hypothetical protein
VGTNVRTATLSEPETPEKGGAVHPTLRWSGTLQKLQTFHQNVVVAVLASPSRAVTVTL